MFLMSGLLRSSSHKMNDTTADREIWDLRIARKKCGKGRETPVQDSLFSSLFHSFQSSFSEERLIAVASLTPLTSFTEAAHPQTPVKTKTK